MKAQYLEFMGKLLVNQHAEVAPPLPDGQECWFLPSFEVYHPRKPEQIGVVFNSSAPFKGISLNDVLLTGPDNVIDPSNDIIDYRMHVHIFGNSPSPAVAIKQAQEMLAASNLRLHKIASNRPAVIEAFPPEDRAKEIKNLDLLTNDLPLQRSLGVS